MSNMMRILGFFVVPIVGVIINVWFLRNSGVSVIAWHVLPYVVAWGLYTFLGSVSVLAGALLMLVVDTWLYTEIYLGTKSSILMTVSLLSTLKVVLLFPLGIALGVFIQNMIDNP